MRRSRGAWDGTLQAWAVRDEEERQGGPGVVARLWSRGPSAARTACALAIVLAALACGDRRAPDALLGRWTPDDPRYEGRALIVSASTLEIGQGGSRSEIFPIDGVDSEADVEGGTLYVLQYRNAEGDGRTMRVIALPGSPPRLRFENHDELWSRQGDSGRTPGGES